MKKSIVSIAVFTALFFVLAGAMNAQQTITTQQNPLVTTTTNGKTVWDLVVPHRPDDRKTRLTYQQMNYGFYLISQDTSKVEEFVDQYEREVKPGPSAWEQAETLVLAYTNGRPLTDPQAQRNDSAPEIRIVTDPEQIRQYFHLDPDKDFKRMDWRRDPVGDCRIGQRKDLLKNIEAVDRKWDELYVLAKNNGEAIKQALRACINTPGNTKKCMDRPMSEINFLRRNHGRGPGSVGENESYFKGTNTPNAHATFFYVENLGWKGVGWECCGNPLEVFEVIKLSFDAFNPGIKTPTNLTCRIESDKQVLTSRADVATFRLLLEPEQRAEDAAIDWFLAGTRFAGNSRIVTVSGQQTRQPDINYPVAVQVAVGTILVSCNAKIRLQFPPPPSQTVQTPPTPSCLLEASRTTLGPKDIAVFTASTQNELPGSRSEWLVNGKVVEKDKAKLTLRGDQYNNIRSATGNVKLSIAFRLYQGESYVECTATIELTPPPVVTSKRPCGPAAWRCWVPPVAGAAGAGVYLASKGGGPGRTPGSPVEKRPVGAPGPQ